ncbi:MAG: hypothetical protein CMO80_24150 [Verrucomicrobiales bacterium]|nr:hypothetical protein [Verrucomicrobiales bacterium]|tara:strand:+ start:840 stop:2438 length:1599 start_codon:yes stop_codon:yes gene_type:complete
MSTRNRFKESKVAKIVLVLVASVFALLLAEGVVRVLRLVPPVHAIWLDDDDAVYVRSTNAILSHVIRPGVTLEHKNGKATVNSFGLRDRERELAKPDGVRRIVVLGDSVVEGIAYVSDEDTITRQWENLYPDGKTEVLNLGTAGYCTRAEIELFERKGLAFQPDVVVLIFVRNDFQNFIPEHTVGGGVIQRPEWSKHMFVGSHMFRMLCLGFNWFDFATEGDPLNWNREAVGENNVVVGLERLRNLANQHGFSVLVTVWPEFRNEQIVHTQLMPDNSGALVIERLAVMNGLPVVRMAEPFNEHYRSLGEGVVARTHYTANGDQMHPNGEASRVAAEALKQLLDRGLPPPPYRVRPTDVPAVEVARHIGANKSEKHQPMEARRVRALLRQGRGDEAEAYLRGLLKSDPEHIYANKALGGMLFDAKRTKESIPYQRKAADLEPTNVNNWVSLSISHVTLSNVPAAMKVLKEGMQRSPDSASLHFNLGYIFMTQDDLTNAMQELRKAVAIDPNFPDAAWMLERVEQGLSERQSNR